MDKICKSFGSSSSLRRCKWCREVKSLPRRKRICDECKQQQFFKSKHWVWLESAAMKYGIQCLPDDTNELIKLLELRKKQTRWSGWYRKDSELDCTYKYELAHRYPACDGGKLIADNLVIMPMILNRKMGKRHGQGLLCYRTDKIEKVTRKELRREFLKKYEISKLEGFANPANDKGSDFETDGMDVMGVMTHEAERLGFVYTPLEEMDFIQEYSIMTKQYDAICGTEKALAMTINVKEALSTLDTDNQDKYIGDLLSPDLEWAGEDESEVMKGISSLMGMDENDISQLDAVSFRSVLEDADYLSPLIDEQSTMYCRLQDERNMRNKCIKDGGDRWWH
ncbi:hypothetical protein VIBNISO65_970034 [Vibrio nigripulchritudo SO65]|uniref:hypothetical protein n=1 Tax=Vibrio nigripulchritudo TaxID=28173 RepID=UPI0003B1C145|nr:hypothetical protein [Vibrio nigripulchritudo]CCN33410.1 hypothetical protein VIBNIAM115_1200087 [Vibrio nigripulchritudo AM115]CCN42950.1 hypothetical protein VIBNIFTn2_420087 [Vibrio nigripulchritudo FTn2]CCN65408.1 hypothetical protein VIBNIPon4_390034 [Vibrio nigripulchritudo POn4]CCN79473.1 hypothetical protein VIBNISO65_970034 [Vibrio nigripulchritudo SO65]